MDDFTQFDAFERCREYARGIAEHLNRGAFSKDPRANKRVAEDPVIGLLKFRGGI